MLSILLLFLTDTLFALSCGPHEIYIHEQWVRAYIKSDGINVAAHEKKAHCREVSRSNYFQNSTKQTFKNIRTNIKNWKADEQKIVQELILKTPKWLQDYKLTEILRGEFGGHPLNPAATIPLTRTLIIFDRFFSEVNKLAIVTHELSHIAFYDIDSSLIETFAQASGWKFPEGEKPIPPSVLLLEDSKLSVSEDMANHIEYFYTDPNHLMIKNPLAYIVIKEIVRTKEAK
jgi:hypothetical protein